MTTTPNGHLTREQKHQLHELNARYHPMIADADRAYQAATQNKKTIEKSYLRDRQQILSNGHDQEP